MAALSHVEIERIVRLARDPRPPKGEALAELSERAVRAAELLATWSVAGPSFLSDLDALRRGVHSRYFRRLAARLAKTYPELKIEILRAALAPLIGRTRLLQPATYLARALAQNGFTRTEIGLILRELGMLRTRVDPDDPDDGEPLRISVQKRLRPRRK